MSGVTEFTIGVPDASLEDLRGRLVRTRFAPNVVAGGEGGTDPRYLADFVSSWITDFDWRATEGRLNELPQKMVEAGGVDVHVFHAPARHASAGAPPIPLLLTHGWPSSFFEFLPLVGALTDPAAHGGDPADAFDVVIPSLPGFGFSEALEGRTEPSRIAGLWVDVMTALGYGRFAAYGGDIGSHVTNFLGAHHPDRLIGLVTHHPNLHPVLVGVPLSPVEERYLASRKTTPSNKDYSYADVQTARPNSLAAGLSDSPAGLAAWILDKYREWSDCHGDLESVIDRRMLVDIITLYWVTNSIGTSFLPYVHDAATPPLPPVTAPAGILLTPEDSRYPREFAARTYSDIRLWQEAAPGGHFLALENPDRLLDFLRKFFRPMR